MSKKTETTEAVTEHPFAGFKPNVQLKGKKGAKSIVGRGTIADLSTKLRSATSKPWENPSTTSFVNGLVVMGGATKIGNMPSGGRKGKTAAIYEFNAEIG